MRTVMGLAPGASLLLNQYLHDGRAQAHMQPCNLWGERGECVCPAEFGCNSYVHLALPEQHANMHCATDMRVRTTKQ